VVTGARPALLLVTTCVIIVKRGDQSPCMKTSKYGVVATSCRPGIAVRLIGEEREKPQRKSRRETSFSHHSNQQLVCWVKIPLAMTASPGAIVRVSRVCRQMQKIDGTFTNTIDTTDSNGVLMALKDTSASATCADVQSAPGQWMNASEEHSISMLPVRCLAGNSTSFHSRVRLCFRPGDTLP